jgi:hypothetical protein
MDQATTQDKSSHQQIQTNRYLGLVLYWQAARKLKRERGLQNTILYGARRLLDMVIISGETCGYTRGPSSEQCSELDAVVESLLEKVHGQRLDATFPDL